MVIYMVLRSAFHAPGVCVGGGVGSPSGPICDFVLTAGSNSHEEILEFGCLIFRINVVDMVSGLIGLSYGVGVMLSDLQIFLVVGSLSN